MSASNTALGEPNTAYFTVTALMETSRWEATGHGDQRTQGKIILGKS